MLLVVGQCAFPSVALSYSVNSLNINSWVLLLARLILCANLSMCAEPCPPKIITFIEGVVINCTFPLWLNQNAKKYYI
jgi:hypothetical protein